MVRITYYLLNGSSVSTTTEDDFVRVRVSTVGILERCECFIVERNERAPGEDVLRHVSMVIPTHAVSTVRLEEPASDTGHIAEVVSAGKHAVAS